MSTLSDLFTFEARTLDPIFHQYLVARSGHVDALAAGSPAHSIALSYQRQALSWLSQAQAALQAPGASQDQLYGAVGTRYDVVVGNLNRLVEDGLPDAGVQAAMLSGFTGEIDRRLGVVAQYVPPKPAVVAAIIVGIVLVIVLTLRR